LRPKDLNRCTAPSSTVAIASQVRLIVRGSFAGRLQHGGISLVTNDGTVEALELVKLGSTGTLSSLISIVRV
jgi:hypothetical protein